MTLQLNATFNGNPINLNVYGGGLFPPIVPAFGVLSYNQDQIFAAANTPEVVKFDTVDVPLLNFSLVQSGVIQVNQIGSYVATVQSEVDNGGGVQTCYMWSQIDRGVGFINVPRSTVKIRLASQAEIAQTLIFADRLNPGDKVRFMAQVSDVSLSFQYSPAIGAVPATPATIVTLVKVG